MRNRIIFGALLSLALVTAAAGWTINGPAVAGVIQRVLLQGTTVSDTTQGEPIYSSNGALFAFGQLLSCEDQTLSACVTYDSGTPVNLTASGPIKGAPGVLRGAFVAQSTSCTIKIWNNTAASGAVVLNTFTVPAVGWYPMPFRGSIGLYATLGGTCDVTFSFF